MSMDIDLYREEQRAILKGSLLEFIKFFYKHLTGRDFIVSKPYGRESHHVTICKALTAASNLEIPSHRLVINVSPGSGKSTMLAMWVAWTLAKWPDSRFLYISYSKELASKHTETIKRIIQLPMYAYLFDVKIRHDSKAREYFQTVDGGAVAALGSSGAITGRDAGLPGLGRFTGAVIIDDAHKPDEVHSDTIRQSVIKNYSETIQQRPRGVNVPFIFIGQRLHEDDLAAHLLDGKDGYNWHRVILKSLDEAGNALYPEVDPSEKLLTRQQTDPYVFASQYQQNPIPAGGALFKPEWFLMLDEEPEMLCTFITADTAETNKSWNDATALSFWGYYDVTFNGRKTGQRALHWLACEELRLEPKDLQGAFIDFYSHCMTHPVPPLLAAIEKKSTGVTLLSALSALPGLAVRDVGRTIADGSKADRHIKMQPYIASHQITFTHNAIHAKRCIEHMSKITANATHRHDDICDTAYDAVRIALIDKTLYFDKSIDEDRKVIAQNMSNRLSKTLGTIKTRNAFKLK